jgi:hypothetical protein
MTDERPTEGTPPTAQPAQPAQPPPLTAADEPPPLTSAAEPPPLAPYVGGQSAAAPPAPDPSPTQPVAAWEPPTPASAQQPAVAWQPPAAPVETRAGRTGWAAVAGIALIVLAVGGMLIGLAAMASATLIDDYFDFGQVPELGPNAGDVVGSVVTFFGAIIIAYSVVYLIGGIGVLRSRDWGRVIGIVVGVLSGLFWLASVSGAGNMATSSGGTSSIVFPLVLLIVHVYIVVVLAMLWRAKRTA